MLYWVGFLCSCASAGECYWMPRETSSFYCSRYSSSHKYFADFMCSYCCTGELCNRDTVASPDSPFLPTVIPPNPITNPPVKSSKYNFFFMSSFHFGKGCIYCFEPVGWSVDYGLSDQNLEISLGD